jgi:hypothetical protein
MSMGAAGELTDEQRARIAMSKQAALIRLAATAGKQDGGAPAVTEEQRQRIQRQRMVALERREESQARALREGQWGRLPEELLLKVLDLLGWTPRDSGAVRGACRAWRAAHDANIKTLHVRKLMPSAPMKGMHAFFQRLPTLTSLNLYKTKSMMDEELRAVGALTVLTSLNLTHCSKVTDAGMLEVGDLTALTYLNISYCSLVTDEGMRELRGLTALTKLDLHRCSNVTDVGLQELIPLTALTWLRSSGTNTNKKGRDALKAAIPGLKIVQ